MLCRTILFCKSQSKHCMEPTFHTQVFPDIHSKIFPFILSLKFSKLFRNINLMYPSVSVKDVAARTVGNVLILSRALSFFLMWAKCTCFHFPFHLRVKQATLTHVGKHILYKQPNSSQTLPLLLFNIIFWYYSAK